MNVHTETNLDPGATDTLSLFSRREFLQRLGGGIAVLIAFDPSIEAEAQGWRPDYPSDFNAFLLIGEDGRVTCLSGKIEMGQGVVTSLAQMLAEDLDVSLESVDMVMGDTARCPWDIGTFGSMSIRFFGPALREAAAEARGVLIELAAESLGVPKEQLATENGTIFDTVRKTKRVTYAQLAKGKTIERHLVAKPAVKAVSDFRVMGKGAGRTDARAKVTGEAKFAGDIRLPGMLYAKILRPPAHGAALKNVDTTAAEKVEGAQVVRDGDLIAVLHEQPDLAEKALEKIEAEFGDTEAQPDTESIFDYLVEKAPGGKTVAQGGNVAEGEKTGTAVSEETYLDGYVSHAPMETHSAVARIEGGEATVWASTQTPFGLRDMVAGALGIPGEKVRILTPFVGGGFGGKSGGQQAVEAARLAKKTGKPVQVVWSRAEEFFYDTFRPAAVVKIRSGTGDTGRIAFWDYKVFFAGERGSQQFYDIPHHSTVAAGEWRGDGPSPHPFAVGAWRAPASNTNSFARESQIDIRAAKAGIDPVEFRLKNLRDKRMRKTLETAARGFGWTPATSPSGRGLGVACGIDAGTYVALIAEVDVDEKTGRVQAKRVVCGQDMGVVVNPKGAVQQIEGCIIMGLGYALSEDVRFRGGQILEKNFDTYELPRFSWVPEIEAHLVENDALAPQGGGEPAIVCMGGVIANAIYDAVGARLHRMPMTPERVKDALGRRGSGGE
jgi:nicotinate dehydrogenase subunit B